MRARPALGIRIERIGLYCPENQWPRSFKILSILGRASRLQLGFQNRTQVTVLHGFAAPPQLQPATSLPPVDDHLRWKLARLRRDFPAVFDLRPIARSLGHRPMTSCQRVIDFELETAHPRR